ncbi:undecaprenyl-diphosphate phosphatase [Neptunomonas antarctica]|uniref:Undecaprenyl-diphosphatase n=1 Tax=Neptunomonas antarctica TaxID=619304 RepID=A0A1N7J828_9GAMM|nr:undecaprenyl-diphosphate phosphatase [Neptunomonas antarctica]SIS45469.1 undecaprenyl-diphosphatase [Neptunomonas antarctica]
MDLLQGITLGIIEGITEFLPISSTGHLIIASDLLGLPATDSNKAFEVIIQLAAILAVVANYRDKFTFRHTTLWMKVAVSFIPIGIVGLLFHSQIKELFSVEVVATMFIIGGLIFLWVERRLKHHEPTVNDVEDITFPQAAIIGIAQVFALIPGTSRAGATIIGALLLGINRKASAEFSFLLAMPVMVAASGLDLLKHYQDFIGVNAWPLIAGFVMAFLSAYIVMRLFISFLDRWTFVAFGVYRIIFGLLLFYMVYAGLISTEATA